MKNTRANEREIISTLLIKRNFIKKLYYLELKVKI